MKQYKLTDICNEYIIETGGNKNLFSRYYQYGVSCVRDLSMDISAIPKVEELFLNDNDTVDLPCDFLNYLSISVVGRDGVLHGLGKNNKINLNTSFNDCGAPVRLAPANQTYNPFFGLTNPTYLAQHWRNGENIGAYFNAGGRNLVGNYKVDYNAGKILLSNVSCISIILEYIADISADNDDYTVHPFIIEAIKAWIFWKSIQRDRNRGIGERQLAEHDYIKARKKAVKRYQGSTAQEWLDAFRTVNSGVAKF